MVRHGLLRFARNDSFGLFKVESEIISDRHSQHSKKLTPE
jgi:hypothetical protein